LPVVATAAIGLVLTAGGLAAAKYKPWKHFPLGLAKSGKAIPKMATKAAAAEPALTPLAQGQQALKDGKLDVARQAAEDLVKGDPKDEAAHLLLGQVLAKQRYGQKAEAELLTAQQLNPKDPAPLRALGDLKITEADLAAAIAAYQKAQVLAPSDVPTQLALAKLYGLRGDWKGELAMLDAAYHRVGEQPDLLAEAGFARYQLNDDAKAEDDLRRALKLAPNLPRALYVLGFVRYRQGKIPEAETAYRSAAAADPKSTEALLALADLFKAENQAAKAADVYKEVRVRDPKAQIPK
jgi:Flp pilus assembly protein TadD